MTNDKISNNKISDYQSTGNAIGLAKIGAEPFTIVDVEDSQYDGSPSIVIITQKAITVDNTDYIKFYTSRKAVMDILSNEKLREDLKNGKSIGPVKCITTESKSGGNPYWILKDV